MKAPQHVGKVFRECRKHLGLTVFDCALRVAARRTNRSIEAPQVCSFVRAAEHSLRLLERAGDEATPQRRIVILSGAAFLDLQAATGRSAVRWNDLHERWSLWADTVGGQ